MDNHTIPTTISPILDSLDIIHKINYIDGNKIYDYISNNSDNNLNYFWLGQRDYNKIWNLQKIIQEEIKNDRMNDVILFLEAKPDRGKINPPHPAGSCIDIPVSIKVTFFGKSS